MNARVTGLRGLEFAVFDLNESGDLGAISVLGIMLLVVSFAVVLLANRLPLLGGPRLPALR